MIRTRRGRSSVGGALVFVSRGVNDEGLNDEGLIHGQGIKWDLSRIDAP